jgi:glyoxylase-like metal-dependent hydrolase (beta-lactamase superfamily II)
MKTLHAASSIALATLVAVGAAASLRAQQPAAAPPALELLPVQGNVYMLAGAGGNITLMVGKEGVLMVDTGLAASAARVTAEVRKLSTGPIRWVINTHVHPDHVGGNEAIAALPADPLQPLRIVAHENVLNRMTTPTAVAQGPDVARGLPVDEYFTPIKDIHFNGEAIVLYHEAKAHTDGDSVVLFRGSDVVSTGDIFTPDGYPFIDLDNGGSVQGEIAALNHILDLTVPAKTQEGGTYVIPGHGRICDEADVVEFRDMVVIVRDRVRDAINKKMTLEQVKAARLTRDYDPQYVTPTSFVTTDRFVEALYKDLSQAASAKPAAPPAKPGTGNRAPAPAGKK